MIKRLAPVALVASLAACGAGERSNVGETGAVRVDHLEWATRAELRQTSEYVEFGFCDFEYIRDLKQGEKDLVKPVDCDVPDGATNITLDLLEDDNAMWRYTILETETVDSCTMNSRQFKPNFTDQALQTPPIQYCEDFGGQEDLPGMEVVPVSTHYFIGFEGADADLLVQADWAQWNNIPLGVDLEISVSENTLTCYAPAGSGICS